MAGRSGWAGLDDPLTYRWLMFGVMAVIYFFVCLHRISTTVIAPDLVLEFGADATALGLMSSAYFYPYAAVQPPVGILSDTWGPRRVVTLFTFIACIGAVIFGTAANMTMATVGRALIGTGVGGVFIPALKIFSRWYRAREFAGLTGLFLAAGNAGNLAASLPLTYLVLLLGWRLSFLSIGALSLCLAVIGWAILRDRPEDRGWPPIQGEESPSSPAPGSGPGIIRTHKRLGIILCQPSFLMITTSFFFFGGPALTFQGLWAVPYLMDVHGYTRLQAGRLLMIIPLGFIIGAPLFGFLADRVGLSRKAILLCSLGLGLGSWGLFFVSGGSPDPNYLVPLFLIMGTCGGGALSLYMTIVKELFPPWLTGTAVGLMNPATFLSTAMFQPFTGFVMDMVGRSGAVYPVEAYEQVFTCFMISMGIAIAAIAPVPVHRMRAPGIS